MTFEEWFKETMTGRAFGSDAGEWAVKEQFKQIWDMAQSQVVVKLPSEDEQGKISWISAVRAIEKAGAIVY